VTLAADPWLGDDVHAALTALGFMLIGYDNGVLG
jgi:hypothetical protein